MPIVCPPVYDANAAEKEIYTDHFSQFAFPLSDFQKYAIEAIVSGNHVLVCAPTGSGKTLPAEFAIKYFTDQGRKVIYTSPIKALSNQKYHDFTQKFPDIQVGLCTGDIKTNPTADLILMTAEILQNHLFRNATNNSEMDNTCGGQGLHFQMDINTELAVVIMDEVHYINDADRGHVWEQTIMTLPDHIQMVMLSATLDGPEEFARWIETSHPNSGKSVYLAATSHRIVPLTHYAWLPSTEGTLKTIKDKSTADMVRKTTNRLITLQTAKNEFQDGGYKEMTAVLATYEQKQISISRKHTLNQLALYLKGQEDPTVDDCLLPAIVFVFSRKQVEQCAKEIQHSLWEFDSKLPYTIANECEHIIRRLPNYREYMELPEYKTLVELLQKGVAIHHSGMLPILREIVEILIGRKYVRLLFATESFAIGLDCPIRTAIFSGLSKYDGNGQRFLYAHEYTQMAGRAGRRGIDIIGNVIHLPTLFRQMPDLAEYRAILCGRPQKLVSKFHIDYAMVLHLFDIGQTANFGKFAEKSMLCGEIGKQIAAQERVVHSAELALREAMQVAANIRTPKEVCEQWLVSKAALKTAVNKKRKDLERTIRNIEDFHRSVKEDCKLVEEREKCAAIAQKEIQYLADLHKYIETYTDKICEVLVLRGYIAQKVDSHVVEYSITDLGKIAAAINEMHPLITAQCILSWNQFSGWTTKQIIVFLSCFADIKVPEEIRKVEPDSRDTFINTRVKQFVDEFNRLGDIEIEHGIDSRVSARENAFCFDLLDEFEDWCDCDSPERCRQFFAQLSGGEKGVSIGDFTKACMKISAITKELDTICDQFHWVELKYKLSKVDEYILKYTATTQSLYV